MSTRWPGGIINQTAPVPSGTFANSPAPGIWTLEQQAYLKQQGLWPIPGNVNPDAFIENLFSTYLYTGNGSTQTITNGIDLAGEGGLTWIKDRNSGAKGHALFDTARGVNKKLQTQSTTSSSDFSGQLTNFNADGFTLGSAGDINSSPTLFCSWTFREAPKFFDVVTYTGTGSARTVAHNLGSVPGMMIVKCTSAGSTNWTVYHRSTGATKYLYLNSTSDAGEFSGYWNNTAPTSTEFTVGNNGDVNANGATYVAYLFAHNAGGFGTAGTDNVISCGSFTGTGASQNISLGYEPQYVLLKTSSTSGWDWYQFDIMKGMSNTDTAFLSPNTSSAENYYGPNDPRVVPNATGFNIVGSTAFNLSGETYIYMAIRRPMKPPTSGTQVFSPITSSASTGTQLTTNFVVDSQWINYRAGASENTAFNDRLRGNSSTTTSSGNILISSSTAAESSVATTRNWGNTGFEVPSYYSGGSTIYWTFRRATGFFDIVCYTGDGTSNRSVNHNLTVVPEIIIAKRRSGSQSWIVFGTAALGAGNYLILNSTDAVANASPLIASTTTTFGAQANFSYNDSGVTYVAYLFASVAGVSKVGSYTGTGATQTINCGFTAGARFVLIKRTDSTGNWWVWDTARGMVTSTDPRLALNSTAAELNNDWVLTISTGFQIVTTDATVNASGASYIFLAIA